MNIIKLPENEQIIKNIYEQFNSNIYLCGSAADHYLLNKEYSELKDLDFVTTSNNIEIVKNLYPKSIKRQSKLNYITYFGHYNYEYIIEIFIDDSISDEDIYLCNKLNLPISSKKFRLKIIDNILDIEHFKNRHLNFIQLKQEYINLY